MRGLEILRRAKGHLESAGDARERLRRAACEFLIAAVEREAWPAEFRIEAELVRAGLLALGAAEGDLNGVGDRAVEQAGRELLAICRKAERVCRSEAHAGSGRRSGSRSPSDLGRRVAFA